MTVGQARPIYKFALFLTLLNHCVQNCVFTSLGFLVVVDPHNQPIAESEVH